MRGKGGKRKRMGKTRFLKLITERYLGWVDIRSRLRRKEISLKEALDLILTRKTVKNFQDFEEKKKERSFLGKTGN